MIMIGHGWYHCLGVVLGVNETVGIFQNKISTAGFEANVDLLAKSEAPQVFGDPFERVQARCGRLCRSRVRFDVVAARLAVEPIVQGHPGRVASTQQGGVKFLQLAFIGLHN